MIRSRSVLGVAALLVGQLSAPAALRAQLSSGHGPLILELPASTAAQAMGGATYLLEGAEGALFRHPASLTAARGLAGAVQRYGRDATLVSLAATAGWWGGGAGLGLRALSFRAVDVTAGLEADDEGDLFAQGNESVSQLAASVGWGRRIGGVALGAVGTLLEQRVGREEDTGAAVALGAAVEVGPFGIGLSVRNLGRSLKLSGEELSLPKNVEVAASARNLRLGPLDLGAIGALTRLADGELVPALGVEVAYWPVVGRTFILRGGARRVPAGPADELSFGAAFQGDEIVLEYAYRGFDGLDGSHRFGIGWR